MFNPLNKNTLNHVRKFDNIQNKFLKSKICINSENLSTPPTKNLTSLVLSKKSEEKIDKKNYFEDDLVNELEVTLWNEDKSKKKIQLVCSKKSTTKFPLRNENCFPSPYDFKNKKSPKLLGNVQIKIFESENGKRSYEFAIDTINSSVIESKKIHDEEEITWKGGKDDINFKINLNQTPTRLNSENKFLPQKSGKENVFGSLFQPTVNNILTPSPKSRSFDFRILCLKLNF
jgi:hypothetical protein